MNDRNRLHTLNEKRKSVLQAGGPEKLAEQKNKGKLTARERIAKLLDEGSFVEVDTFVQHSSAVEGFDATSAPGEGVVAGYGTIAQRPVYIYSQDYTVLSGSLGAMHAKKIVKVLDAAGKTGVPVIGILDSGGARLSEGTFALNGFGEIFKKLVELSGVVPLISVVAGPCAASAAYIAALTDFVFMVDQIGAMFTAGPQVFSAATGEDLDADSLGGAKLQNEKTGNAQFFCQTEDACYTSVKTLLSFLPSNNVEDLPLSECSDDLNRQLTDFNDAQQYDMRELIKAIADNGVFFETQMYFATNIITGLIRLNGWSVGVVANYPETYINTDAADKAAKFIRFCDAFNIPVVSFTDTPGFVIDIKEENAGLIRHGAKLIYAYAQASVPLLNVITGKAIGTAFIAMSSKTLGADMVMAWPQAEISCLGAEAAANILLVDAIQSADDPVKARAEKIAEYREVFASPWAAAKQGAVDDVIAPAETRQRLAAALEMALGKRVNQTPKKHGVMPL